MKKYRLINETYPVGDHVLYRICALHNFADVKAGDLGGWIESEANLSQEGDCWIRDGACVFGQANVSNDAQVCGNALVYGKARVSGKAYVGGRARIFSQALVDGRARVTEDAHIYGNARVIDEARVYGCARVGGNICIDEAAHIHQRIHSQKGGDPQTLYLSEN